MFGLPVVETELLQHCRSVRLQTVRDGWLWDIERSMMANAAEAGLALTNDLYLQIRAAAIVKLDAELAEIGDYLSLTVWQPESLN